ncbi:MAG: hypothetical protein EXR67_01455 [Dehalococcoidia bacterium]|nr:hypothetical protein [Dehalococcoidia bacterium]
MTKQVTKVFSWLLTLALLVSVIAPFAVRPQSAHAAGVITAVTVTTDTVNPGAALGQPSASVVTIVFVTSTGYNAGQSVAYTLPNGTVMPASTVIAANVYAGTGANVAAAVTALAAANTASLTISGQVLTHVSAVMAPGAGAYVALQFIAAANVHPADGTASQGGAQNYIPAVVSVQATTPVTHPLVSSELPLVFATAFVVNPNTVDQFAQWNITFPARTILVSGVDTMILAMPLGVVLPATISKSMVAVSVNGGASNPLNIDPIVGGSLIIGGSANTRNIQITLPNLTPAGVAITNIAAQTPGAASLVMVTIGQSALIKNSASGGPAGAIASGTASGGSILSSNGLQVAINNQARVMFVRTLSHSATSGARGTSVTSTAAGLTSGSSATLWNDANDDNAVTAAEIVLGTGTVGTDGKASIAWIATVPPLATGANANIKVMDNAGLPGANFPKTGFTVLASIRLSSATGVVGSVFTISGDDFAANASIVGPVAGTAAEGISIGGRNCGPSSAVNANAAGQLTATATCTVPLGVPAGVATIRVWTTASSTAAGATATVTLYGATILITPNTGVVGTPGSPVTLTATGLSASSTVACPAGVTINSLAWTPRGGCPTGGNWTLDAAGNFPAAVFEIGTGVASPGLGTTTGTLTVIVTDAAGLNGQTSVTIPSRLMTATPTSGKRGTIITLTGTGWSRASTVTLNYPIPTSATNVIGAATTDGSGNFTVNVTVPLAANPNSLNTITATDAVSLGTNLTAVTHFIPAPTVSATGVGTAATSTVGGNLTIRGDGFPQFVGVDVLTVGGLGVLPAQALNTDANGQFNITIIVPAMNTGVVAVNATAGLFAATTSLTISVATQTVASQVQSIAASVTRVWGYDNGKKAWLLYDIAAPSAANTLLSIVPGDAVNIVVDADCTLTTSTFTRTLTKGNNILGWR